MTNEQDFGFSVDTFGSRVMSKIAEKPGFQAGAMVEVCKDDESVPVSKQKLYVAAGFDGRNRSKRQKNLEILRAIW